MVCGRWQQTQLTNAFLKGPVYTSATTSSTAVMTVMSALIPSANNIRTGMVTSFLDSRFPVNVITAKY
jgi:hypothetical protein